MGKKQVTRTARLDDEDDKALRALAAAEGKSYSATLRGLVRKNAPQFRPSGGGASVQLATNREDPAATALTVYSSEAIGPDPLYNPNSRQLAK